MYFKRLMLPLLAVILFACAGVTHSRKSVSKNSLNTVSLKDSLKTDTSKKEVNKPQPYDKVITSKAVTQRGLFVVHKVEEKYYFELPNILLDKDLLLVNRIIKANAGGGRPLGMYGYAGDIINSNIVRFEKGGNNKVFIKTVSFDERATDSSANGLSRAVDGISLQPIVASFDIKANAPDSTGCVIDVTDYINSDNETFLFNFSLRKQLYALGALQNEKSYIDRINAYPLNVEIKTLKTFGLGEQAKTFLLNSSLVVLPREPMQPRYYDERVGYFSRGFMNFDKDPQGIGFTAMITRWRLEPKKADIEKYKKGELVEPQKPIVFYIDPATPKKWVPYLIQGVNDWQKAFEKAGFKNAIYALEAPVNDSSWSIEDARYSVIVYKPSWAKNASGPHINDPRTGEILESHINWYHNVMQLLHDWYMVQAGPNDPRARKMELDDSVMGKLIRFVSSHEVGHTLGLMHNFGASSTVPVEKLRDKKWVEENGFCPSIMDYARFNYVAQPEDSIGEKGLFPRIGVYDEWAIEWGYKWLPELKTEKEARNYMSNWIIDRVGKDKRLWFGSEGYRYDTRCQSEDVGDNAVIASTYGIKNLERVSKNLLEWTRQPAENYESLTRIHKEVLDQYKRYVFHVARSVGAVNSTPRTMDEKGKVVDFPSKEQQKAAVSFINEYLFNPPSWLWNKDLTAVTGTGTTYNVLDLQQQLLQKLVSNELFVRFEFSRLALGADKAYGPDDMLTDMESSIWKEVKNKKPVDDNKRNVQKSYIIQMLDMLDPPREILYSIKGGGDFFSLPWTRRMDAHSLVKGHLRLILKMIDDGLPFYKDNMTRFHLIDVRDRIKKGLGMDMVNQNGEGPSKTATPAFDSDVNKKISNKPPYSNWKECTMWASEF